MPASACEAEHAAPDQSMRVQFQSSGLALEGDLVVPAGVRGAAVICHPHPQYGGDMDNAVVCAVAGALMDAGCATLRFNFRGVGASGGVYAGGVGEVEDVCAAVRYLQERSTSERVTVAGYSFGAAVGLQAGCSMPQVDRLIAIAPPLTFFDLRFLNACVKEKLFVVGDCDQFCNLETLRQQLASVAEPKSLHVLRGADHFFGGREAALRDLVRSFAE